MDIEVIRKNKRVNLFHCIFKVTKVSLLLCHITFNTNNNTWNRESKYEVLPGVLGNRGIRPFISGEQGNKSLKLKGTGEPQQFWGTGNTENQVLILGNKGKMLIAARGTREQGGPQIYIIGVVFLC